MDKDLIAKLARAAGLDKALAEFPDDVALAAEQALGNQGGDRLPDRSRRRALAADACGDRAMSELHWLTAAEAAREFAARSLSPVELLTALLARIERLDPKLHAFIRLDADAAMDAARAAEAEIAAGRVRGPLHGVPVGIKDIIDVAGLPTTCHSKILLDNVATADAAVVAKLRQAGAIILGKLSTHEFAIGGPSFDLPFPPARNPWNPEHHPGGSSSGSGAGVCAGLFPLALGTDTGGSVRNPASACGIVGLKPTYGLVSRRGVFPLSFTLDHVGPMTRTVADNALLLDAIAGHDPGRPRQCADQRAVFRPHAGSRRARSARRLRAALPRDSTSRRIPRSPPRWRTRRACCRPKARRCAPSRCRR